jgi:site-specific recombinase XerD
MKSKVQYEIGIHQEKPVIFIKFEYNANLTLRIKKLVGSKWSQTNKSWYVPDNITYRQLFQLETEYLHKLQFAKISQNNQIALIRFVETMQLKGFSPNTIKTYQNEFSQFLIAIKSKDVTTIDAEKIRSYILYCINHLKNSEQTIHSRLNALKFYYEKVLFREKLFLEIPRPKKSLTLPKTIHVQDLKKMFEQTKNLKHNTLLKLAYGMGLRVSEIINLKIEDIDSYSMRVLIEKSKGKKDRYVNLPETILLQLREYYKEYKPKKYLFEGQYGGQYSIRSAQQVFKNAMKSANINKSIGIHSLRHSFATHLLENGTDIRFIQELLGHNNIKTTLIYTQVTNQSIKKIISPLDFMK